VAPSAQRIALADGRYLRPLTEADAEELHTVIEANHARLARWMRWAQDQTPRQTREFIQTALASESENRGLQRAIVAGQRIVGMAGLPEIDWPNRSAGVGYWLDEAAQGQGVMTAAVAALVGHAFFSLHLNRVEIRADVENAQSRAVAERLGFTYEGTLRQSYRVVAERYSDDAVYSLLASDPRPTLG
jgi:ribosomal-protein-serine acetyltransferase